ncbi:PLAT/LH2 domain-containing protein [Streptomyces sp. NPDC003032]
MTTQITYRLLVDTAAVADAGTDATVRVQLIGEKGRSPEIELNTEGNDFEAGSRGSYEVTIDDIGGLKQVRFFHDNSGSWPGWCLGHCQVQPGTRTSEYIEGAGGGIGVFDNGSYWNAVLPEGGDAVTVPSIFGKNKRQVVGVWLSTDRGGVDKTFTLDEKRVIGLPVAVGGPPA